MLFLFVIYGAQAWEKELEQKHGRLFVLFVT
jgi:hypothetical protein